MRIYLDSNIVIYFVEQTPVWCDKVHERLAPRLLAGDELIVSDLNRVECLSTPIANDDRDLLADYDIFWKTTIREIVTLSTDVCLRAASIRGHFRFKTPDSIHLAAAVESGCDVFLTNDIPLQRFTGITIELLNQ